MRGIWAEPRSPFTNLPSTGFGSAATSGTVTTTSCAGCWKTPIPDGIGLNVPTGACANTPRNDRDPKGAAADSWVRTNRGAFGCRTPGILSVSVVSGGKRRAIDPAKSHASRQMTTTNHTPDESTAEAKIEAKRDALEVVANSDLSLSDTAVELLAIVDGDDRGDGGK